MEVASTLSYYDAAIITTVKSFMVKAPAVSHFQPSFSFAGRPISDKFL
jgi:hypothetical protein